MTYFFFWPTINYTMISQNMQFANVGLYVRNPVPNIVSFFLVSFFFFLYISLFATLRLAGRPGRDDCQSALWDCFGGRICHHVENASPKAVPQCTLKPSRLSLQRNLKVANMKTFLKMGIHTFKKNRVFIHFCGS